MTKTFKPLPIVLCLLLFSSIANGQSATKTIIIKQLNELKQAVLAADKDKVSSYFEFPIQSEELQLRTEYADEKEIQISSFDKKTFSQFYARIITEDITNLFKSIDFSSLKNSNKVEKKVVPNNKVETCFYTYSISYSSSGVTLSLATDARTDIPVKEENACPEYVENWTFRLKNGKLKFSGFTAAG